MAIVPALPEASPARRRARPVVRVHVIHVEEHRHRPLHVVAAAAVGGLLGRQHPGCFCCAFFLPLLGPQEAAGYATFSRTRVRGAKAMRRPSVCADHTPATCDECAPTRLNARLERRRGAPEAQRVCVSPDLNVATYAFLTWPPVILSEVASFLIPDWGEFEWGFQSVYHLLIF